MRFVNRRQFLQGSSLLALSATGASHVEGLAEGLVPRTRGTFRPTAFTRVHVDGPPDATMMLQLAHRAVEAALTDGATYADVRVTHTLREVYQGNGGGRVGGGDGVINPLDVPVVTWSSPTITGVGLLIGIGIRAFYHGYWGFASSPYWTDDNAAWLGREATRQAKTNATAGAPRAAELGKVPIVQNGRWVEPGIDPFAVSVDEKIDFLMTLPTMIKQQRQSLLGNLRGFQSMDLWREERVFASSEGASYAQVRYRSQLNRFAVRNVALPVSPLYARGWDSLTDLDLNTLLPALIKESEPRAREIPRKAVDVGRYDIVFGAQAAAWFVGKTLGYATELDRALGFEANAAGTSYLGPDPMAFLGTSVAAPLVTVTANRSTPGALATTHWDDEGVVPDEFTLVKDGVLVDYQTTREQADWLAPWYTKRGIPVRSHGCATSASALSIPLQMCPNMVLEPSAESISVEDLIKDTQRGIYWPSPGVASSVDQQVRNGVLAADDVYCPREIRNGTLGAYIGGWGDREISLGRAAILFNSVEFWKNVMAVGGAQGAESYNERQEKGQPNQVAIHTVTASPMKVKELAVVDGERKA